MPTARLHIDSDLPAASALARGAALLPGVTRERPVLLYGAELSGAALVLGAHQHAPHALRAEALELLALPVLRRRSGGAAVWAGQGLLYFALGLLDASTLMPCPKGKLLNRNVRGLLAGLRGLPRRGALLRPRLRELHRRSRRIHRLGRSPRWARPARDLRGARDAVRAARLAYRAIPNEPSPRCVARRRRRCARPAHEQPAREVLQALADGHARSFGLELQSVAPAPDELASAAAHAPALAVDLAAHDGLALVRTP